MPSARRAARAVVGPRPVENRMARARSPTAPPARRAAPRMDVRMVWWRGGTDSFRINPAAHDESGFPSVARARAGRIGPAESGVGAARDSARSVRTGSPQPAVGMISAARFALSPRRCSPRCPTPRPGHRPRPGGTPRCSPFRFSPYGPGQGGMGRRWTAVDSCRPPWPGPQARRAPGGCRTRDRER